jgi:hypothetical protein
MTRKSKFLTFILSAVPGLGHIYIGFNIRGGMFLFAEVAVLFIMFGLGGFDSGGNSGLAAILIPVIWLACLVDSMMLVDRINRIVLGGNNEESIQNLEMEKQNKKVIAMVLSIIPGAGHMFLGLQRQGIQLMLIFFASFFLTDWLGIALFMIIVPVVWFFSLFDVMYKASGIDIQEDNDVLLVSWFNCKSPFIRDTRKFLAFVLIGIGGYLLFEKIILQEILIDLRIRKFVQTGIVALLFIAGGVRLLMGTNITEAVAEVEAAEAEVAKAAVEVEAEAAEAVAEAEAAEVEVEAEAAKAEEAAKVAKEETEEGEE